MVKDASKKMKDNLPDDTTAVVIDVLDINQVDNLKKQNLLIPIELEEGMIIDGYRLEKSITTTL